MFENKLLLKTVGLISLVSFSISVVPSKVYAYNLSPLSFSKMYNLAQNGDVEALRASVRRGMNIDSVNQNGDTGLCVAAQHRDAYTYNAFRAAGANPRHPCVQRIAYYENFVTSSKAVSVTATPREAYGTMGKEEYKISPTTWWLLGGLALGGGIAAIAMSGGGGGGGSSSGEKESYNYIGEDISSSTKSVSGSLAINKDSLLKVSNTDLKKTAQINFNKNVVEAGKSLTIGLEAINNGSYANSENSKIEVGSGAAGMAAVTKGNVINGGYINVDAFNNSIGMIASNHSNANNDGEGVINNSATNGIDLNFSGFDENNLVIGMYADSASTINNNGDIQGTAIKASTNPTKETDKKTNNSGNIIGDILSAEATTTTSSTAVSGTLVGMETMILNTGSTAVNEKTTANNNGKIKLSAGDAGAAASEIKVNLIGMGSYLDDGFMNGSKNIQRADKAVLNNKGTIELGYTGNYTFDTTKTLRKGLGGIVGMRSDANTTAENNGTIKIVLTDNSSSSSSSSNVAVAAGMQSVHSGAITNNKNILINIKGTNSRITYGMIAVEGNGTVSGLYTTNKPIITNNKTIELKASNGYGMASYNGGKVINNGEIRLGSEDNTYYTKNIGIYGSGDSTLTSLTNSIEGVIDIYSSESVAMKNDFSGGTILQNDGTINVYKSAIGTNIFGGNYSNLINNGTINYEATANSSTGGDNSSSGSSSDSDNSGLAADSYNLNITQHIMSTKSPSASATSSGTERIENYGQIRLVTANSAAMSVETKQGTAYNGGIISLVSNSENNNVGNNFVNAGMYLGSDTIITANITNAGTINVESGYSVGMASVSTSISSVINSETGVINVKGHNSFGLYATGNSYLYNNGIINVYGDNNIGIYSKGNGEGQTGAVIKNNLIKIYGKNAVAFQISGTATIENPGIVDVCSAGDSDCNPNAASTMSFYSVSGNLTLKTKQALSQGTLAKLASGSTVTIDKSSELTLLDSGMVIDASKGGTVTNNGTINLNSSDGIGIKAGDSSKITNENIINLDGSKNIGIYASGGEIKNNGKIDIKSSSSKGVNLTGNAKFTNGTGGIINVNKDYTDSTGIYILSNSSESSGSSSGASATNEGKIWIKGDNSTGVYIDGGEFANNGTIISGGTASGDSFVVDNEGITSGYGIRIKNGSATNSGKIYMFGKGESETNMPSAVLVEGGEFTNSGTIHVDGLRQNTGVGSSNIYAIIVSGGTAKNTGTVDLVNGAGQYHGNVEDEKSTTSTTSLSAGILVKSGGVFKNSGMVKTDTVMDFNSATSENSKIVISKNGSYQAKSFKGNVVADADITQNGFDTTYRNDNSFIGKDEGLNVISGSYMFNTEKAVNESGNTDVVMTMKSFDETVANKELASYLSTNYTAQKGEGVFNTLKGASHVSAFNMAINREFGFSMIPNLVKQDLDLLSNINRAANDEILAQTDEINRAKVNVMAYQQEFDGKQNVSGYKDKIKAVYGFSDYQIANNWRAGFGAAAARSDSDFDDDSSRYNNVLEVFAPLTYTNDNFRAMAKPKVGFGKGHYSRRGVDKAYKADLTNYYYGIDAEARQTIDVNVAQIEPVIGANITEVKVDDLKESNSGLKANSDKVTSIQSVIGMDVKKEFELGKEQSVLLTAGGRYFHEFGNKYSTMATMDNMLGSYQISSNRLQRNSGLLTMKAQYDYKKLSLSAAINAPLEQKSNVYYLFNLGYKF